MPDKSPNDNELGIVGDEVELVEARPLGLFWVIEASEESVFFDEIIDAQGPQEKTELSNEFRLF